MTNEEANAAIGKLISEARERIAIAEQLATQHGLTFHFYPANGMGGTFYGVEEYEGQLAYYCKEAPCWVASSETC